jgi:hypothetical protein
MFFGEIYRKYGNVWKYMVIYEKGTVKRNIPYVRIVSIPIMSR